MYRDKEKQKKWFHDWYVRNRSERIRLAKEQKKRNAAWYREYKKRQKCSLCEESDWRCLDFHHRDPKSKSFSVSTRTGYSIKTMLQEIEKCDVLCSNCHRKTTMG